MAKTTKERLLDALRTANKLAVNGVVRSRNLRQCDKSVLVKNGCLRKIIKGWYMVFPLDCIDPIDDSIIWKSTFWPFLSEYLSSRFDDYWLSPESSIAIHSARNTLPTHIVVYTTVGTQESVSLPSGIKLTITDTQKNASSLVMYKGVNILPLDYALAHSMPHSYRTYPTDYQVALHQADYSDLLKELVETKNLASINRIIGGYKAIGKQSESEMLRVTMEAVFESVKPVNPFI